MHGKLRGHTTKRSSLREYLGILVMLLIALGLATLSDREGMPQKWHAAILGTVVPFGVAVMSLRRRWARRTFWTALLMCLAVHILLMWIFFERVLSNIQNFGTIYWFPVAFVETFVLLLVVKRVEEKLTGTRETYKLS
jgi:threonine/homoserine efflux transporter RhtA